MNGSQDWIWGAIAAGIMLFLLTGWLAWRWYMNPMRRVDRSLKRKAWDMVRDVVIPDGMDGMVHIDRLLITPRGLMVLDLKQVDGAVFGAEKMDEWVVMSGGRRYSFRNPLGHLDERISALKYFLPEAQVEGYVLMPGNVEFPKGRPTRTLLAEDLEARLESVEGDIPESWQSPWSKIREHAEKA